MDRLLQEWQMRTDVDGLRLTLVRQGAPVMRWRVTKRVFGKQQYIDLFAPDAPPIIAQASADLVRLLSGYESHRLLLNARSRVCLLYTSPSPRD